MSRSHRRRDRVILVNGETIVDRNTVNGKRVPSGGIDAPHQG